MRYGVTLPGGSAGEQLAQAVLAEESGWDGVFVWEAPYGIDAWTLLGAMAAATSTVKLGTILTPLPWRRPWKVASQVVTLDQLSGGRAILAVGLGAVMPDMPATGEELELRARADLLDDGIDMIRALWAGEQHVTTRSYHYDCETDDQARAGRPVQERIPIWVVGAWPRPKSMRRVLRCDGILPQFMGDEDEHHGSTDGIRSMRAWLAEHGARPDIEVISEGETPADDLEAGRAIVAPRAEAGATWWMEVRWDMPHDSAERMAEIRKRLAAGPPRV